MLSESGTNKKGMAFLQLSSEEDVVAALELHQSKFGGRSINVERSTKKQAKRKARGDENEDAEE